MAPVIRSGMLFSPSTLLIGIATSLMEAAIILDTFITRARLFFYTDFTFGVKSLRSVDKEAKQPTVCYHLIKNYRNN